jgi:hypothetical protein
MVVYSWSTHFFNHPLALNPLRVVFAHTSHHNVVMIRTNSDFSMRDEAGWKHGTGALAVNGAAGLKIGSNADVDRHRGVWKLTLDSLLVGRF